MRVDLKNVVYVGLMVLVLAFSSCQKEKHVVIQEEEQEESLTASSSTINLLARTSSNDGSWDNIIDGCSCFDVNFPYTVWANDTEILIESKADLILVEEIFDAFDSDNDLLRVNFPITVVMGDYSEVVFSSKDEMLAAAKLCVEGGIDDDIECLDINYPITVYSFDASIQIIDNYIFNNDFELRRYIASLDEGDKLSIQFPISFKLNDGTEHVANSFEEITNTISSAMNQCDEDDDNDHNDDDFTKESLDALLIECPWSFTEFEKNSINQINYYKDYILVFNNDYTVHAVDQEGNSILGVWSTSMVDYDLIVAINFDDLEDFNKQWHVYEIRKGKVKFYTEEESKIVMITDCQIVVPVKNPLREVLLHCEWVVDKNIREGQTSDKLQGYKFVFNEDDTVVMSGGQIVSEGTYNIHVNEQEQIMLSIEMDYEPSITYEWPLKSLEGNYITFGADVNQLELNRVCDDNENDANVVELRGYMSTELWHIYNYVEDEQDLTLDYEGDLISFLDSDKVTMEVYQATINNIGLWRVSLNIQNQLVVYLNFDQTSERTALNAIWDVVEYTANHIVLTTHNEDGKVRNLTLQK
ncbi:hypothetical protein [Aurantibacter sp.]|uniref:hypothetical protein n=1 Tax=Aurantibacter sp. TaxID=2807103 RepID=UPI0032643AEE